MNALPFWRTRSARGKGNDQKQAEIDDTYELFKLRFRAMTATQNTSTLGLVLGAEDFSEF